MDNNSWLDKKVHLCNMSSLHHVYGSSCETALPAPCSWRCVGGCCCLRFPLSPPAVWWCSWLICPAFPWSWLYPPLSLLCFSQVWISEAAEDKEHKPELTSCGCMSPCGRVVHVVTDGELGHRVLKFQRTWPLTSGFLKVITLSMDLFDFFMCMPFILFIIWHICLWHGTKLKEKVAQVKYLNLQNFALKCSTVMSYSPLLETELPDASDFSNTTYNRGWLSIQHFVLVNAVLLAFGLLVIKHDSEETFKCREGILSKKKKKLGREQKKGFTKWGRSVMINRVFCHYSVSL